MDQPTNVVRLHSHPTTHPVVLLHVKDGHARISADNPAHAVGPFTDESVAMAWEEAEPSHGCYPIIVDLLDPWEQRAL